MLPGSSPERVDREAAKGKQSGRTVEIQRLIGRSLRAACDLTLLGERQVVVDCDVLQADGGTRTASICGGFLALHDALARLVAAGRSTAHPLHSFCAAVSVGIVGGVPVLDLPYVEDSTADVDMNVVTIRPIGGGETRFVEVQGTAEGAPFSHSELATLLALAERGLAEIVDLQAEMIAEPPRRAPAVTAAADRRPRQLVCASANPSKVAEIAASSVGGDRAAAAARPTCPTSSRTPARWSATPASRRRRSPRASGLPGLADDTGLEVAALGGLPGVDTATYAGPERPTRRTGRSCSPPWPSQTDRRARFRTIAMVVWPDGDELFAEGTCDGEIVRDATWQRTGSATTACSCRPTATGARSPR